MIARWVRALGRAWPARSHGPWVMLGLVVVLAVWSRLLTTPGELLQRDLEYPLFAVDVLDDFYPMLASDGRSALGHMSLTPVVGLAGAVVELIGGTSGAMIRALVVGQSLAAFTTMYFLFQLLAGKARRSAAATGAGALAAGLFYSLNPWAMARVEHLGLLLGYSLLPLVLGLAILAVQRRSLRMVVGSGLAFWFAAASPHYLVFTAAILTGLAAYHVGRSRSREEAGLVLRLGAGGVATIVGLEMFLILPALASSWMSGGLPAEIAANAEDVAIGGGSGSLLSVLTLTNNPVWADEMQPESQARWTWQMIALLPVSALVWVTASRKFRPRVGVLLIVLAGAALMLEVLVQREAGSGISGFAISRIPGGRALREPDKLSGLLVMAFAWGVGGVVSVLALSLKDPTRRMAERVGAPGLLLAVAIAMLAIVTPAIRHFLWTDEVANWLPHRWPAGYEQPILALRAEEGSVRVIVFERDERVPVWDGTRVLRQPVSRSLAGVPVVGWRHSGNSVFLTAISQLEMEQLAPIFRAAGANRLLVVHDTREGSELNELVATSDGFEMLVEGEYATLYSVREAPTRLGFAAVIWQPVYGLNGVVGNGVSVDAPTLIMVADAGLSGCPAELTVLPVVGSEPTSDAMPPCTLPERLIRMRPDAGKVTGWEATGGSAAELSRWVQATGRHDLSVREYDYGLGFAWIEPGLLGIRESIFTVGPVAAGTQLHLRALVGRSAASLEVEALDASGAVVGRTRIAAGGAVRMEWVPIEAGDGGGWLRLRITAAEGFGAVNVVGLGRSWSGAAPVEGPSESDPPSVRVERETRTELRARIEGAADTFALVVNENYSPVWRALYPGGEARPFPVGYARMGFVIPALGEYEVRIAFVPQHWHDLGLLLSGFVLTIAAGYLVWPVVRRAAQSGRRARHTTEVP